LIEELWRARVEGRFGLRHWLLAWIISTRFFAVPWVFLYTLFGSLLAGFTDPRAGVGAAITASLALLVAHFRNNYRDVELGLDRYVDSPEEARRVISMAKPYTAAAWLVPLRITPVWFQKANELLFLALTLAAYTLLVGPLSKPWTIPFLLAGLAMALMYTDFFKPRRLGEVAGFIGHGMGTVTFGYLSQSPDIVTAVIAGIPTGLISALAFTVDQYVDLKESDFLAKARALYEVWFNARLPLSLLVIASALAYYQLVIAWVAAGVYPRGVLVSLATLPLIIYWSAMLEWNREKALRNLALTIVWLLPGLMALGALIT